MNHRVEALVASIMDDRRSDYLFETKRAAQAVGCHKNKFGDWYRRTRRKLIELYLDQPGEFAAEIAALIAMAESERARRIEESLSVRGRHTNRGAE